MLYHSTAQDGTGPLLSELNCKVPEKMLKTKKKYKKFFIETLPLRLARQDLVNDFSAGLGFPSHPRPRPAVFTEKVRPVPTTPSRVTVEPYNWREPHGLTEPHGHGWVRATPAPTANPTHAQAAQGASPTADPAESGWKLRRPARRLPRASGAVRRGSGPPPGVPAPFGSSSPPPFSAAAGSPRSLGSRPAVSAASARTGRRRRWRARRAGPPGPLGEGRAPTPPAAPGRRQPRPAKGPARSHWAERLRQRPGPVGSIALTSCFGSGHFGRTRMEAPKNTRMEEAATGESGCSWGERAQAATGNGAAAAPRPRPPSNPPFCPPLPWGGPARHPRRHFRPRRRAARVPRRWEQLRARTPFS